MGAISDLWNSERGFLAALLIITSVALVAMGKLAAGDWTTYTLTIYGVYAGVKTVSGVTAMIKAPPTVGEIKPIKPVDPPHTP